MLVKLTDQRDRTHGDTQWGPGVTHEAPGKGDLCTEGWIHYYEDEYLAVLMNPAHGGFENPHGWKIKIGGRTKRDAFKSGAQRVTTIERCDLPEFTMEQRVYFAILCAKEVCVDAAWNEWADRWISGEDRSPAAADAAAKVPAWDAANTAADAAAWSAARSAEAADAAADAESVVVIDFPSLARKAHQWEG